VSGEKMTEQEWRALPDPKKMLASLPLLQRAGRKKNLFVAAICRTVDGIFLNEEEQTWAVCLLESVAEGWKGKGAADRSISLTTNLLESNVVYNKTGKAWMVSVLRCIFGNPFRPATISPAILTWHDAIIPRLAQAIYDERQMPAGTFDLARMNILADALLDAGCDNEEIIQHCRSDKSHVRGCWVVDLILGKS
jgi:hypothetical protein